jgi:gamma-glutamylputrescine oxidase
MAQKQEAAHLIPLDGERLTVYQVSRKLVPAIRMSLAQTYYEATSSPLPARSPLGHDIDTDICVIGGGFAGLWAARALQKRHKSVVLIERNRVAHAASGRNGGFISAGFNQGMSAIIARVGMDHARALYRISRLGVEVVREETKLGFPGINVTPGYLKVAVDDDAKRMQRKAEWYARELDHEMEYWPLERVREALPTHRYYQALNEADAFSIHPLNLAIALAEEIERSGGKIYEDTPALDADIDGVRKIVTTPRGKIRAEHVVFCANDAPGAAFSSLARTVIPVATYLSVTRPLGERLSGAIRFSGCIQDERHSFNYYRAIGDRLLWGAGISTNLKRPTHLENWFAERIAAVYPQLSGCGIESAWTGVMGFSVHRMPQIGMLRPGAWIASAFGGQGLNTTAMAGELIASAIAEKDDRWRLFIPFGLVWAGGWFGKTFVQMNWWSRKLHDRIDDVRRKKKRAA